MALSQTQVVNLALTKLGQDRVISIADDVEAARAMASLWDFTRDIVLAAHPWKFAILRKDLPALAAAPEATSWTLQYALPEPCLRLVQVGEEWSFYGVDYETFALEGGMVLTDQGAPLRVRYVQRVTNVGLWPVLFARCVAMQLAADACYKLTNSTALQGACLAELDLWVRAATRQNAIERPPQKTLDGAWLASRGD